MFLELGVTCKSDDKKRKHFMNCTVFAKGYNKYSLEKLKREKITLDIPLTKYIQLIVKNLHLSEHLFYIIRIT